MWASGLQKTHLVHSLMLTGTELENRILGQLHCLTCHVSVCSSSREGIYIVIEIIRPKLFPRCRRPLKSILIRSKLLLILGQILSQLLGSLIINCRLNHSLVWHIINPRNIFSYVHYFRRTTTRNRNSHTSKPSRRAIAPHSLLSYHQNFDRLLYTKYGIISRWQLEDGMWRCLKCGSAEAGDLNP